NLDLRTIGSMGKFSPIVARQNKRRLNWWRVGATRRCPSLRPIPDAVWHTGCDLLIVNKKSIMLKNGNIARLFIRF
ncbi:hypothetical protein, partial [Serratia marcescens]|uniref:hypothetical protein n=1 Tax=Serratia marcescens TaxID=615 RepID=UPI0019556556